MAILVVTTFVAADRETGHHVSWLASPRRRTLRRMKEGFGVFRLHRTARARRDKVREARQWANEVTEYINATYPPVTMQAYAERFGDVGKIHFFSDYADLATLERLMGLWKRDEKYRAMLERARDLFMDEIEGSFHDTLMQAV